MIQVDDDGETTIVVDPGANATLTVDPAALDADVVLTVLEVPDEPVATAMAASGFTVLNAAPARAVAGDVLAGLDLLCVNAGEYGALAAHADLEDVRRRRDHPRCRGGRAAPPRAGRRPRRVAAGRRRRRHRRRATRSPPRSRSRWPPASTTRAP